MPNLNIESAVEKLVSQALPGSAGRCAKFVREAIEAGGIKFITHPVEAKNYGPTLSRAGFKRYVLKDGVLIDEFVCQGYRPEKGDIVVIPNVKGGSPAGHIAMFSGEDWISDFKQNDIWGGGAYRAAKPVVELFRSK